jgi:hypothetical protein
MILGPGIQPRRKMAGIPEFTPRLQDSSEAALKFEGGTRTRWGKLELRPVVLLDLDETAVQASHVGSVL